jgi:hypothetical protein
MKLLGRLAVPAVVVVALVAGWWAWSAHDSRAQHRVIAALVADTSTDIRAWVDAVPTNEQVVAAESRLEALSAAKKSRKREFASAAEVYLVGARALAQRRADAARLAAHAQAARRALATHMSGAARRDEGWIREASELRRRSGQAYGDLKRTLEAVAELTYTMPQATRRLTPYVPRSSLVDDATFDAAHKRAEAQAKAASAEQESAGRKPAPR